MIHGYYGVELLCTFRNEKCVSGKWPLNVYLLLPHGGHGRDNCCELFPTDGAVLAGVRIQSADGDLGPSYPKELRKSPFREKDEAPHILLGNVGRDLGERDVRSQKKNPQLFAHEHHRIIADAHGAGNDPRVARERHASIADGLLGDRRSRDGRNRACLAETQRAYNVIYRHLPREHVRLPIAQDILLNVLKIDYEQRFGIVADEARDLNYIGLLYSREPNPATGRLADGLKKRKIAHDELVDGALVSKKLAVRLDDDLRSNPGRIAHCNCNDWFLHIGLGIYHSGLGQTSTSCFPRRAVVDTGLANHIIDTMRSWLWRPGCFKLTVTLCVIVALLAVPSSAEGAAAARLQDASGALVTVPANAQRIVSLAPNLTEILCGMGLGSKLVGVSSYSNYPPAVNRLPKVGGFAALNVEKIVSLSPDIAVGTMDGNSETDIRRLRSLGIAVFCVFPNNMQGLMQSISRLGKLFRNENKAEELVGNIELVVKHVKSKADRLARTKGRPKVLVALDIKPIVSASAQTFIGELVATAGGANVVGAYTIRYPRLSLETVVASAPDVILVTGHGSQKALLEELRQLKRWQEVPAVKNCRVYLLDPDLTTRPGPRSAGALITIHEKLFPE